MTKVRAKVIIFLFPSAVKEIKDQMADVELFSFGDTATFGIHLNPKILSSPKDTPPRNQYTKFNGENSNL